MISQSKIHQYECDSVHRVVRGYRPSSRTQPIDRHSYRCYCWELARPAQAAVAGVDGVVGTPVADEEVARVEAEAVEHAANDLGVAAAAAAAAAAAWCAVVEQHRG
jgi:hypothetical protein